MNAEDEKYRRECEAREWIKRGFINKEVVNELMKRIRKQRGQKAADELRAEMRKQWLLKFRS